jgi:hypothetical protein
VIVTQGSTVLQVPDQLVPYPHDTGLFGIKLPNIGKALGSVVKAVGKIDPVTNIIHRVASGERVDKALGNAVKDQRKIAKTLAPVLRVAATGASFIPGLGTGAAAALGTAAAWGQGKSLAGAIQQGASGALPGGAITQQALGMASRIAKGERIDRALVAQGIQAAGAVGGPLAENAARAAVGIAQGERLAKIAGEQIGNLTRAYGGDIAQRAAAASLAIARGQNPKAALASVANEVARRYGGAAAQRVTQAAMTLAQGQSIGKAAQGAVIGAITDKGQKMFSSLTPRLGSIRNADLDTIRRAPILNNVLTTTGPYGTRAAIAQKFLSQNPNLMALNDSALARRLGLPTSAVAAIRQGNPPLRWLGLSRPGARFISNRSLVSPRVLSRDTGALAPDGKSYTVESGDTGQKIAKKLVGDINRWPEIKAANPAIAKRKDPPPGFKNKLGLVIYPRDVLALPASWIKTSTNATEQTAASVMQAQGILAAWQKTDGSSQPGLTDYGLNPEDVNGTWDSRDRLELMAFARWRGRGLTTDGSLTEQHLAELRAWAEEAARKVLPIPIPTLPTPTPTPAPTPTPTPPPVARFPDLPAQMPPDFTIPTPTSPVVGLPATPPVLALPPVGGPVVVSPPVLPPVLTPPAAPPKTEAKKTADSGAGLIGIAAATAWAFGLF